MVKAFDDDTITFTFFHILVTESRARPWDSLDPVDCSTLTVIFNVAALLDRTFPFSENPRETGVRPQPCNPYTLTATFSKTLSQLVDLLFDSSDTRPITY